MPKPVPVELHSIERDLLSLPSLEEVERLRLLAYAQALLADPPQRRKAVDRLLALPDAERRRVNEAAVAAVLADGRVLPIEVRFLEGRHSALGLPSEQVYAALNRQGVRDDDPVVVADEERTPGIALPKNDEALPETLKIDARRLARIKGETQQVSALLASIFVEDEEQQEVPSTHVSEQGASRFADLDPRHAELLWEVLQRPLEWSEFEQLSRDARLLPAGAVETINEWGFELFEETILEGEDAMFVQEHLIGQLLEMGRSS